jgi:NAD(P)-dependent dehydrogenase (short-subunit alcohol dehydrogenase family)
MSDRKVVLVTGASAGFGRLMVESFARKGYETFAAMRDPAGKNDKARREIEALGLPVTSVALDVTSDAEVEAGVAEVIRKAGRIDVLVNNAGIGLVGIAECSSIEQARFVFETNYFGVQRMNRAVLPHMREQRSGLLVHVSSGIGRMVVPLMAHYVASKFALEALAESYRYELAGAGVDSVIVEPGAYPTTFGHNAPMHDDKARATSYGPLAGAVENMGKMFESMFRDNPPDPQEVVDAIVTLAETPFGKRPLRTPVGREMDGVRALNALSDQIAERVLSMFGMAPPKS